MSYLATIKDGILDFITLVPYKEEYDIFLNGLVMKEKIKSISRTLLWMANFFILGAVILTVSFFIVILDVTLYRILGIISPEQLQKLILCQFLVIPISYFLKQYFKTISKKTENISGMKRVDFATRLEKNENDLKDELFHTFVKSNEILTKKNLKR